MARLDPLLLALVERHAHELILTAGQRPTFRFGDELRAVSTQELNRAQIYSLLDELGRRVDAGGGSDAAFLYEDPTGRGFRCEIADHGEIFEARLRAADGASTPLAVANPAPRVATVSRSGAPPAVQRSEAAAEQALPPASTAPRTAVVETSEGEPEIDGYLRRMVADGASDLHLCAAEAPRMRLDGDIVKVAGAPVLTTERTRELLAPIMPATNREEFAATHDTDFAYEITGLARFRVNVFTDRHGTGAVFRTIPADIMTAEQLGLPPAVLELCALPKGLVLVTGPTGSGKSTTLAAMIDHINRSRTDHIITIEDPIEFVHSNRNCLINQREVHTHTQGFKRALRAALREDPDIVLVGEMRDLETIAIAIETAETGHLVFGTLHTTTAISTVDRIIDQFPSDRQAQIRTMLAESLKGVVAQTLLKKIGGGRVAALEILIVTPAISNLVREGKTFQIPSLMQTGKKHGMGLLNDSLMDLVKRRVVEPDEAYRRAVDKNGLASMLRAAGLKAAAVGDA